MDSPLWIYLLGLSAQLFYVGRVLVQWYLSEKHHKVESPSLFWIFSMAGSVILFCYGYLRQDLSIIFGEFLSYYIYMWNIGIKGLYKKCLKLLVWAQGLFPVLIISLMLKDLPQFTATFLRNSYMPAALLAFGTLGQFVYKMRFVYQIIYSVRRKESVLPLGYWLMAVSGSLMIICYGVIRHDWVLIAGQVGIVASIRNMMIYFSSQKANDEKAV